MKSQTKKPTNLEFTWSKFVLVSCGFLVSRVVGRQNTARTIFYAGTNCRRRRRCYNGVPVLRKAKPEQKAFWLLLRKLTIFSLRVTNNWRMHESKVQVVTSPGFVQTPQAFRIFKRGLPPISWPTWLLPHLTGYGFVHIVSGARSLLVARVLAQTLRHIKW